MTVELELRSISKRYPGVVANDAIDLEVHAGEVHAIVGENGAGKSTLMSILYGLVTPDEGEILVRGEPVHFRSPLDAIDAGLGMVHQAFQLFPTMTVAENVVYGREPRRGLFIDRSRANAEVRDLADQFGLGIDVNARVEDLGVGALQRVEILKVLYRDARVLILDEPTAALTPKERDVLFDVVGQLRDTGRTILFITHKLNEVMATSERVTVLRRGRVVEEMLVADTTGAALSLAMTGRNIDTSRRRHEHTPGERVLSVHGLDVDDSSGVRRVSGVDLDVAAGEIVGIAGVTGSGQTELVEALIGLRSATGGTIRLGDVDLAPLDVRERRDAGLAYVPEDRQRIGSAGGCTTSENLLMGYQWRDRFQKRQWLRRPAIAEHAERLVADFDIKVSDPEQQVKELSGGNLQKVVVAREMTHDGPVLVVEQPTRGVDVGAIEFIHAQIIDQRDAGRAIVLISTELWEILALSTRILVMFSGRIVAELLPADTDEIEIGLHMTGASGIADG